MFHVNNSRHYKICLVSYTYNYIGKLFLLSRNLVSGNESVKNNFQKKVTFLYVYLYLTFNKISIHQPCNQTLLQFRA